MLDDFKLNRASKLPYYYQVYNYLINKIKDKKLQEGYKLPNEIQLCDLFNVSRTTIRESLRDLETNGYIRRGRGQGTFIAKTTLPSTSINKVSSIVDELKEKGIDTETKILEQKTINPDPKLQSILGIDENTGVLFIKRLMIAENEPLYITNAYFPNDIITGIEKEQLVNLSFTRLVEDYFGLEVVHKKKVLEPDIPDEYISNVLKFGEDEKKVINHLKTYWKVIFKGLERLIYFEEYFKSSKSKFIFES